MAHQINYKLSQPNGDVNSNVTLPNGQIPHNGAAHQQSNESVDLDNLFAFLSEVTPNSNHSNSSTVSTNNNSSSIMDDIEEKMDNLVQDLDIELENVLQQEIEGLALDQPTQSKNSSAKMGVPSLPEPTMRPPPPPNVVNGKNAPIKVSNKCSTQSELSKKAPIPPVKPQLIPPIVKSNKQIARHEEPIYEAVIPRQELPVVLEMPEPIINCQENNHKLR